MIVSVDLEGTNYLVEIEGEDDFPKRIILRGRKMDIDMGPEWLKHFVKSLLVMGNSYRIEFGYEERGIPKSVWVNGVPSDVQIDFPGKGKLTGQSVTVSLGSLQDRIVAPIPGKITEVRVHEGQEVSKGQVLIVLEAMKMENELSAPRDALVKQILCREGDNVDLEQTLINLS
jgi:hypothetical protein